METYDKIINDEAFLNDIWLTLSPTHRYRLLQETGINLNKKFEELEETKIEKGERQFEMYHDNLDKLEI